MREVGSRFYLLPFRHYPVEDMYDSPLRVVLSAEEQMAPAVFQVVTDGSSKQNVGGYAAVLMPAYGDVEMAVVGRGKMQGRATNIQAELQAAIQGLKMILQVYRAVGVAHFELLTDSMYVVQLLEDSMTSVRHAGQAAELLALWQRLLLIATVQVRWVKGHSNHLINDIADRHAKMSLVHEDCSVSYLHALTDVVVSGGAGRAPKFDLLRPRTPRKISVFRSRTFPQLPCLPFCPSSHLDARLGRAFNSTLHLHLISACLQIPTCMRDAFLSCLELANCNFVTASECGARVKDSTAGRSSSRCQTLSTCVASRTLQRALE